MKRFATALSIVAAVSGFGVVSAHAGPCGDEVARLEALARETNARNGVGPTARQSIDAQLHHQPTRQSVEQAQASAAAKVGAVLKRAKTLDMDGDEAGCMKAIGEAKLLLKVE
jgi:hypothetical protein